jgi:hypothetical protein
MDRQLEDRILEAFANELEQDGKGVTLDKLQAITDLTNALYAVRQATK